MKRLINSISQLDFNSISSIVPISCYFPTSSRTGFLKDIYAIISFLKTNNVSKLFIQEKAPTMVEILEGKIAEDFKFCKTFFFKANNIPFNLEIDIYGYGFFIAGIDLKINDFESDDFNVVDIQKANWKLMLYDWAEHDEMIYLLNAIISQDTLQIHNLLTKRARYIPSDDYIANKDKYSLLSNLYAFYANSAVHKDFIFEAAIGYCKSKYCENKSSQGVMIFNPQTGDYYSFVEPNNKKISAICECTFFKTYFNFINLKLMRFIKYENCQIITDSIRYIPINNLDEECDNRIAELCRHVQVKIDRNILESWLCENLQFYMRNEEILSAMKTPIQDKFYFLFRKLNICFEVLSMQYSIKVLNSLFNGLRKDFIPEFNPEKLLECNQYVLSWVKENQNRYDFIEDFFRLNNCITENKIELDINLKLSIEDNSIPEFTKFMKNFKELRDSLIEAKWGFLLSRQKVFFDATLNTKLNYGVPLSWIQNLSE